MGKVMSNLFDRWIASVACSACWPFGCIRHGALGVVLCRHHRHVQLQAALGVSANGRSTDRRLVADSDPDVSVYGLYRGQYR